MKTFYQVLEIAPSALADEIKRAFRLQIARYHPDKVQHLGKEFQEMAAERAAQLTEAYRILSDEQLRAEYDRRLTSDGIEAPSAAAPRASGAGFTTAAAPQAPVHEPDAATASANAGRFADERAMRDRVVRRAALNRFERSLTASGSGYDGAQVDGFDFAWLPKSRLFARGKGPRLAGRLVPRVDGDSIAAAFADAGTWAATDDVCVFLVGDDLAAAGELARAIAGQRRRPAGRRVTVIPVDARSWDAHVPIEAPPIVKRVLERVKTGT